MDRIPPGPPAVLGIDLGTSQVKALLAAADGTVLGQGAAGYQVSTPRDGWAETDLDQWWRATAAAVRSATGASDTAASLHAASLAPRWGLLTLGSGGQWIIPGAGTSTRPAAGTNLLRSADGGTFRLAGAQNVGVTLDWVRRTLGASWDGLYATAARPWRSGTPVFLPYLAGERWAHRDAGGAWTGLTLAHQRDDLLRAALEGVAFLLRSQLDDLRAAAEFTGEQAPVLVLLAGGGSRPAAWRQLLADALNVPLQPAPVPGGSAAAGWLTARGAALLAAQAAGLAARAGTPDRSDPAPAVVLPRETAAART